MSQLCDIRRPVRTLAEDIVKIRYQEKTSEDRKHVRCSYELCVQVFSGTNHQSKTPSTVTHTRDSICTVTVSRNACWPVVRAECSLLSLLIQTVHIDTSLF
jgi:hypothetical protein